MKLLSACLITLLSLSVYSQKKLDLKVVDKLDFEVIKKIDSTDLVVKQDTIIHKDIKAEYLDHTVYNPYKD